MLINSLCTYAITKDSPHLIEAKISIDAGHSIFEGHFPGQPIVPGVCMVQMMKEIIEEQRQIKLDMIEADNIKFLSVWVPAIYPEVFASISLNVDNGLRADGVLFAGEITFLKLKASFVNR
ncbi:MAG: hydroxymyristoyl-ACP dehydratase [Cyclobacteriaceae bacterium]